MRFRMLLLLTLGLNWPVSGQEPAKNEKSLPAPRPLTIELVPYRENRYDVWQYYGVDRYGRFRPRVIAAPHHAYYLRNGMPYPWLSTHMLDYMPYVVE